MQNMNYTWKETFSFETFPVKQVIYFTQDPNQTQLQYLREKHWQFLSVLCILELQAEFGKLRGLTQGLSLSFVCMGASPSSSFKWTMEL